MGILLPKGLEKCRNVSLITGLALKDIMQKLDHVAPRVSLVDWCVSSHMIGQDSILRSDAKKYFLMNSLVPAWMACLSPDQEGISGGACKLARTPDR